MTTRKVSAQGAAKSEIDRPSECIDHSSAESTGFSGDGAYCNWALALVGNAYREIVRIGLSTTCTRPSLPDQTLTFLPWKRMFEEETQHFPRCVRPSRIGVGACRTASRPCVSSSVDVPALKDSAPARGGIDRTRIGMSSRYSPAMHLLLSDGHSRELLTNLIAIVRMNRRVSIAVKDNGRDRRLIT
jgi:hypothetical protein